MKKGLFENKWNVRIISLIFAIFLYVFVVSENNAFVIQSAANQQFASINVTETIDNVPVTVGPISENTFISGLPESVQVRLTGPRNVINQVLEKDIAVQTEDLTDIPPGTQQIQFIIEDLPDSVDYQITPSRRYVKISQLETITSDIEYDIAEGAIASGFEVSQVVIKPTQVQLTGDVETIQQIDRVFINISSPTPAEGNFNGTYHLQIVNAEGEILDVNSNISEIEANVVVSQPQAEVGMYVTPFGEDQANFTYNYVITAPASLVVTGDGAMNVGSLGVVVDVTGLTESTTVAGQLEIPEGVTVVSSTDIQVQVEIIAHSPGEESQESSPPVEESESSSTEVDSSVAESEGVETPSAPPTEVPVSESENN